MTTTPDALEQVSAADADGRTLTGVGVAPEALQATIDQATERAPQPETPPRDESGKFQKPTRGQKRFSQLTAAREQEAARAAEAIARAEAAERERDELKARLETPAPPVTDVQAPPPAPAPERPQFTKPLPTLAEFAERPDAIEAHARAVAEWVLEKDKFERQDDLDARIGARLEADRASRAFLDRVRDVGARGKEAYPDFEAVIAKQTEPIFHPAQLQVIAEMDGSEHVQYALAKNLPEAKRIARLDPIRFGMEIAKLVPSAPVASPASTVRPVAQTNAPPPIQPVGSGTRTTSPSLAELAASGNFEAYQAARRASGGSGRR